MKKNLFLAGLLTTFSLVAKSQVGINTTTPAATLDVIAKNSTGTTTTVEGLLIPRVDRQRAQSMTGVPTSTLIYVNSIATGTASGTALNIDAVGYYYYNGTVWTKLTPTFNPVNLYNANGTLTGNRTVTQGANRLAFTGTQTNAFSVDGTTLSVDAANDRVGVGTAAPAVSLDIAAKNSTGTTTAAEGLLIPRVDRQRAQSMTGVPTSTLIYVNSIATGTASGTALNIDAVGYYYYNGTVWTKLTPTFNPVNLYNANGTLTGNRTVTQGANRLAFTGTQTNAFSVDGTTLSVDAANDRVGVGTTAPDTKLTIITPDNNFGLHQTNGSVSLKSYIGGGVVSLGTTTANALRFTTNNTQKMSITSAGNVGIGTVSPTNKLVVLGSNAQPSALGTAATNATFRIDGSTNHALDFGTYTNSPYGSYISSHNKTSATGLPLALNPVGGNVGIGTSAPNNSALLDLTATNRGFLLPRVSLTNIKDGTTVPSPAKGLMVYNSNTALTPYGEGIYYNAGTSAAPSWNKLAPQSTDYQLLGVFPATATAPVNQTATGNGVIVNNLNLGLSVPVTIPANSIAKIIVDYNVPVGSTNTVGAERGYYGIRFLRNNVEAPAGSRKYTIPEGDNGSQMVSTVGKYSETYNNTSSSPVVITYTLNGYAESTNHPIRFNMWAASGQNFNWGVGAMTVTVFTKDN